MNKQQLQQAQRQVTPAMLGALVSGASRRFVASARLVEWYSPIVQSLSTLGVQRPVDIWSLQVPFDVLCARYRESLYTHSVFNQLRYGGLGDLVLAHVCPSSSSLSVVHSGWLQAIGRLCLPIAHHS